MKKISLLLLLLGISLLTGCATTKSPEGPLYLNDYQLQRNMIRLLDNQSPILHIWEV